MSRRIIILACVLVLTIACTFSKNNLLQISSSEPLQDSIEFYAKSFCFPVGKKGTEGYYNAQGFGGKHKHLGDDWNGVDGGNTDLGDPIYACANGYVSEVKNYQGGWGNVVRIVHYLNDSSKVESIYAHCDTILTKQNSWVKKGTKIATIGDAFGKYPAHLHFEIRTKIGRGIGGGYGTNINGNLNPTKFIKEHP